MGKRGRDNDNTPFKPRVGLIVTIGLFTGYSISIFQQASVLRDIATCYDRGVRTFENENPAMGAKSFSLEEHFDSTTEETTSQSQGTRTLKVVPERLIAVFGLESSGTTFLSNTLAKAVGATSSRIAKARYYDDMHMLTADNKTCIQHISLPWGFHLDDSSAEETKDIHTVPFLAPRDCMSFPLYDTVELQREQDAVPPDPACEVEIGLDERVRYPRRFFVDIVNHVRWYQERGSNVTVVLMIRDESIHLFGKVRYAQYSVELAKKEDDYGKSLMKAAMQELKSPSELIVTSYETLMSLQDAYVTDIYHKLGIKSTYMPTFADGNKKYIADSIRRRHHT